MKEMYRNLFEKLVKSYYSDEFETTVNKLLSDENIDKVYLSEVISSLCGVTLKFSENYVEDLNNAIKNYHADHKIVDKVSGCTMDCADGDGKTRCQKSCPFDAILIDKETHSSYIDNDRCVNCGFCVEACSSGKIIDKIEFLPFADLLKDGKPVIAEVAPAIVGQFGDDVTIDQLRSAFKKIGFTDMIEVAFFADMLTIKEAVEFDHHVHTKEDLMITSCCCPMWVGMLKRVYNDLVKHVSPSVSPMVAGGRVLKKLNPDCKVVFIGPCIAKKAEAKDKDLLGDIDYVLTFTEVKDIFDALGIVPSELPEDHSSEYASKGGRLYARTGGVSIAVGDTIQRMFPEKYKLFKPVQAHGVANCKDILAKAQSGEIDANFIEGMGCVGGCVGGPKAIIPKDKGKTYVDDFAEKSEFKVALDSSCMNYILSKLDIDAKDDFKNEEKIQIFERNF